MILETLIVSGALVLLGGLWLADRVEGRAHHASAPAPKPKVWMEPFYNPLANNYCPMCQATGCVSLPVACVSNGSASSDCPGFPVLHHHVECSFCNAKWMRLTSAASRRG
jgi:hypothetical protein